jgi:type I restriction enzyme, S subunit
MVGDWQCLSLREAGVTLIDCDHRTPPPAVTGYPYVAIPQLRDGHIDFSSARRITREHYAEWTKRAKPTADDVVLSRRCNPGETAFVPPGVEFAVGQNLVLLRADGNCIYPPFLRWLAHGPEWWDQIRTFLNVGAVFDSLKCADVPNFKLTIPPLPVQRAIAHILGTLDDKIELNRRMNATLEAMARALFKSWFVDFDPVRAKLALSGVEGAEGRDKGLPREIADLFPDGFEESEVGAMPRGWRVAAIGDVVKAVGGTTPSTKEPAFWDGNINFATPRDLASLSSPALMDTERCITEAGLRQISSGLLPKGTVLMSSRAPIGYLAITEIPVAVNQGFIAMICDGPLPNHYVLHWAHHNMETIIGNANGTTFLEISKANFRPLQVLVPPPDVLTAFVAQVDPLYRRVVANLKQSRTLAALRDALLPKLISGEVRVGDVERFVGAAQG